MLLSEIVLRPDDAGREKNAGGSKKEVVRREIEEKNISIYIKEKEKPFETEKTGKREREGEQQQQPSLYIKWVGNG